MHSNFVLIFPNGRRGCSQFTLTRFISSIYSKIEYLEVYPETYKISSLVEYPSCYSRISYLHSKNEASDFILRYMSIVAVLDDFVGS